MCCLASLSNSRKIETDEAVFNHSNTAWREEGADSNTRSEEQFCDLAVMLKNWESERLWAVVLYNLNAHC